MTKAVVMLAKKIPVEHLIICLKLMQLFVPLYVHLSVLQRQSFEIPKFKKKKKFELIIAHYILLNVIIQYTLE